MKKLLCSKSFIFLVFLVLLYACDETVDPQKPKDSTSLVQLKHIWTENWNIKAPQKRRAHAMTAGKDGKVILFGGMDQTILGDTWEYDVFTKDWRNVSPINTPQPRAFHKMANVNNGKIILFGGKSEITFYSDIWEFDVNNYTWTQFSVLGIQPETRAYHSLCYAGNETLLLFGGAYPNPDGRYTFLGDTWVYNCVNHVGVQITNSSRNPSPRAWHSLAYAGGTQCLLFGGATYVDSGSSQAYLYYHDTWIFDTSTNQWTETNTYGTIPSARAFHEMSFAGGNKVVMHGGFCGGIYFQSTWEYDSSNNIWTEISPVYFPTGRLFHQICYIRDGLVLLFGGNFYSSSSLYDLNDCWEYE